MLIQTLNYDDQYIISDKMFGEIVYWLFVYMYQ